MPKQACNLKLKLLHKGLLLVLAPLTIEFLFIATLWHLLDCADAEALRVAHAKQVLAELSHLQVLLLNMGRMAFLFNFQKNDINRSHFIAQEVAVHQQVEKLDMLCSVDKNEREQFATLRGAVQHLIFTGERQLRMEDHFMQRSDITGADFGDLFRDKGLSFREVLGQITDLEKSRQAEQQASESRWRHNLRIWIAVCLASHLVLATLVATYFYRNLLKRLNVLLQNANLLAAGKQLLPQLQGNDEIDQFDAAFHKMADQLAAAAEYKRQMIAVVSHELRTPLTAIRGSLTLLAAGALGTLNEKQRIMATRTEAICGRLIELINALLDKEKEEHARAK